MIWYWNLRRRGLQQAISKKNCNHSPYTPTWNHEDINKCTRRECQMNFTKLRNKSKPFNRCNKITRCTAFRIKGSTCPTVYTSTSNKKKQKFNSIYKKILMRMLKVQQKNISSKACYFLIKVNPLHIGTSENIKTTLLVYQKRWVRAKRHAQKPLNQTYKLKTPFCNFCGINAEIQNSRF